MTFGVYALLFVSGAGALAAWMHVRFRRFAPQELRGVLTHAGLALVACQFVAPVLNSALIATGRGDLKLLAVIGVALPALCYALLSFSWVVALIQAAIRRGMLG